VWQRFQRGFDRRLKSFIRNVYEPSLDLALRWRYVTLAIGVATVMITVGLVRGGWVKFTFFPTPPGEDVVALLTMPLGTPREKTSDAVFRIAEAADVLREEATERWGEGSIRHVMTSVGEQPYRNNQRGPAAGRTGAYGEHLGEVNLQLAPLDEVDTDGQALARRWRELVGSVPDAVELTFSSYLFTPAEPINVQLAANDLDELRGAAEKVKAALAEYAGVFDVTDSFRTGKEEIQLAIRPEAESLGLTLSDLARQVRQAFYGEEAQRIQRGRDDVKVMVRYPEARRRSLGDVEGLRVRAAGGVEVPFGTVAEIEMGRGYSTILRADRRRVINVTADVNLDEGNPNEILASLVTDDLPPILDEHRGVTWSFEGEQKQQSDTLGSLFRGLGVALFVIYALLAVPLRSYMQPFIIMIAIPFGFVGAVWGHMIMGLSPLHRRARGALRGGRERQPHPGGLRQPEAGGGSRADRRGPGVRGRALPADPADVVDDVRGDLAVAAGEEPAGAVPQAARRVARLRGDLRDVPDPRPRSRRLPDPAGPARPARAARGDDAGRPAGRGGGLTGIELRNVRS
jgi:multidrug efflux pump subunit AcrB